MENKIKEKQDIIIRIINDPDLGEWIVALITGEKADTPQDETTAEILKKLGYVQEDNDVWTITEEGKRFAEKLGLVETTKLFEDEKLPKLVSKSSAIKTKVKVSSQPLSRV